MCLNSRIIKKIYTGELARKYDFSMPPLFARWKKRAILDSSLQSGDRVLVFCCGTGLDFASILEKIGRDGEIVGVDFSSEMLALAEERISKNSWSNIRLLEADVTRFDHLSEQYFDAGVCTLGMSIIPDYQSAYHRLKANIRKRGEIIIADMQLASGRLAKLNPLTLLLAKKFGGTYEGHQNSLHLAEMMKNELDEVKKTELFFRSYFYCIGKVK